MVHYPNKLGLSWLFRSVVAAYGFQVRRLPTARTIAGISSPFWMNWWTEPEADIAADVESASTTSTTETKVLEIYAFETPHHELAIPYAIQYKAKPGIYGDGTNTVTLSKVEFEFGVIHKEKNKLIPIDTRSITVNYSSTATAPDYRYVWSEVININRRLRPILLSRIYYKIALYGYVSAGTGYFVLDVRANQPHNMVRIFAYKISISPEFLDHIAKKIINV